MYVSREEKGPETWRIYVVRSGTGVMIQQRKLKMILRQVRREPGE